MHGRQRSESKAQLRDPKVVAKLQEKAVAWHQLQTELLQRRRRSAASEHPKVSSTTTTTTTTLALLEKAVTVNPDPLWLWNFRAELLVLGLDDDRSNSSTPTTSIWETEQAVTQQALQANPKSYGAWQYRKRCLQQHLCDNYNNNHNNNQNQTVLDAELALTAQFFRRDERNFHCWSYRRFVISCCLWNNNNTNNTNSSGSAVKAPPLGEWRLNDTDEENEKDKQLWMGAQIAAASSNSQNNIIDNENTTTTTMMMMMNRDNTVTAILEQEWAFTEEKIRDNFSNFSAFHYRSKLLPILLRQRRAPPPPSEESESIVVSKELDLVLNAVFTEPDDQTAWWYQRFLLDFMQSSRYFGSHVSEYDRLLQSHTDQLGELQQEYPDGKWVLLGYLQCLQYSRDNTSEECVSILERLIQLDPDRNERYLHMQRQCTPKSGMRPADSPST